MYALHAFRTLVAYVRIMYARWRKSSLRGLDFLQASRDERASRSRDRETLETRIRLCPPPRGPGAREGVPGPVPRSVRPRQGNEDPARVVRRARAEAVGVVGRAGIEDRVTTGFLGAIAAIKRKHQIA